MTADEQKEVDAKIAEVTAEADKKVEAANKEAEDARLEVFTQDYTEFVKTKGAAAEKPAPKADEVQPPAPVEGDWEKMTKKQIYDKAVADTTATLGKKIDDFTTSEQASKDSKSKIEVAKFARDHKDYEDVRPTMYGLAISKEHANDSLLELYDAAVARIKKVAGVTDGQKASSRLAGGEKPNKSAPGAHTKDKNYTASSAADEAWEETVGPDGLTGTV